MADLAELMAARRQKLARLRSRGVNPYPYRFAYTHRIRDVHARFDALKEGESPETVGACGRMISFRDHGKSAFAHIEDATGRLQVYLRRDILGDAAWAGIADLDIGDFLGVRGPVMRTRTGEMTVKAVEVELLAKALRPPPEKWHGLKDTDARYRHRHVDLSSNPPAREVFRLRARAIQAMRDWLNARAYLEVETPVLQPLYGGAEATPFVTTYESLKMTYYLRISNELYLKRLIAGGLDRVYEFSKDFRNEGIDRFHSPELTLLELYEAYADYGDMMRIAEEMLGAVVGEIKGGNVVTYQGRPLDFTAPWRRVPFVPALAAKLGFDPLSASDADLREAAAAAHVPGADSYARPKLLDKLFGALVQPHLDGPAFVTDHPIELSPLAKVNRSDPRLAERFEPVLAGIEIGNAFSELNDPDEQLRRFQAQRDLKSQGQTETHELDQDFLAVLQYGMPPTGGLGIGIDRLVMILCDVTSIREVILFPQLHPEPSHEPQP